MRVNELVNTIGYTKNILSHISIVMFNLKTEAMISVKHPTADEYIKLCDRKILEWYPTDMLEEKDDCIEIYVKMKKSDYETFKSYRSF